MKVAAKPQISPPSLSPHRLFLSVGEMPSPNPFVTLAYTMVVFVVRPSSFRINHAMHEVALLSMILFPFPHGPLLTGRHVCCTEVPNQGLSFLVLLRWHVRFPCATLPHNFSFCVFLLFAFSLLRHRMS